MNFIKQHKLHLIALSLLLVISIGSLVLLVNENGISKGSLYSADASIGMTDDIDVDIELTAKKTNDAVNDVIYSVEDDEIVSSSSPHNNIKSPTVISTVVEKSLKEDSPLYTPYSLLVNDKEYNLNLSKDKEYTVYELMQLLSADSKKPFMFKTKEYTGMGYFVTSINGIENNPKENQYWIYFINEESAKMGISQYVIKKGDVIQWKFEESKF